MVKDNHFSGYPDSYNKVSHCRQFTPDDGGDDGHMFVPIDNKHDNTDPKTQPYPQEDSTINPSKNVTKLPEAVPNPNPQPTIFLSV